MTRREKYILGGVGGVVLAAVLLYLAVDALLLSQVRKNDQDQTKTLNDITKLTQKKLIDERIAGQLDKMIVRTLGAKPEVVSETVLTRLNDLAEKCTLEGWSSPTPKWTVLTAETLPKATKGDKQVGWKVQARGTLEQITSFLYLLDNEPYLHRVQNLRIAPKDSRFDFEVSFYTVVLAVADGKTPTTIPADAPIAELGNRKGQYAMIASRDLFRPYIKRPPQAAPPPQNVQPAKPPEKTPDQPPPTATFRLVGLPDLGADQQIWIMNTRTNETRFLKIGQKFAGAEIVMVDHRPIPNPANKDVVSYGRMIQRIDNVYYVTELGQNISDRREIRTSELPAVLATASSAPASRSARETR